ncbi:hypothetical protein ACR78F_08625 [Sphingobacterium spiritivorum]|uniref:hypothetical protein n=1 Tax=Sphingobacterium spiritivorum TaxID=258 RepID=UPI003DA4B6C0
MNNRFRNEKKGKILFMIPFIIGMVFLLVWVVQSLWNALLPEIIGVKAISYWQAFGILVLSKILFGGFRFKGKGKACDRSHLRSKLEQLSTEDKEKFKEEWKQRFSRRWHDC